MRLVVYIIVDVAGWCGMRLNASLVGMRKG
jgi:hypothetical protein